MGDPEGCSAPGQAVAVSGEGLWILSFAQGPDLRDRSECRLARCQSQGDHISAE